MFISYLELPASDLLAQRDFYANILELPVTFSPAGLEVKAGKTDLIFTQATPDFGGAYHLAFNIPGSQFQAAKKWLSGRVPLLQDEEEKMSSSLKAGIQNSVYFKDVAGNVLEFIAHHNLNDVVEGDFDGRQILQVSEIGLPAENVVALADELCSTLEFVRFQAAAE